MITVAFNIQKPTPMLHCDMRTSVFVLSFQGEMDLKIVPSQIPRHLQVTSPYSSIHSQQTTGQLFCIFNSQSSLLLPQALCQWPWPWLPASWLCFLCLLFWCLCTNRGRTPIRADVCITDVHKQTHSFPYPCYESNINLSHRVPHSALSDTYFLSVRWINCISHSRKHIHTLSEVFRSVSIHSQWPISHFLSPRCTRAGEDGQVSFPTDCRAAVYIHQLQNTAALQNNNNTVNMDILLCSGHHVFLHNR